MICLSKTVVHTVLFHGASEVVLEPSGAENVHSETEYFAKPILCGTCVSLFIY